MVRLLYLALALSTICYPAWVPTLSTAAAQDGATTAQRARRLFEHGVALAQSERWAEALAAFRRSAELVPRASTSYNIANALYRLDRPVDALAELDRYEEMPEVRAGGTAWERGAALRELLDAAVAEVRLAITPASAKVSVDGRLSAATGLDRTLRLNPGTHSIHITHEDYASALREVQVARGSRQAYTIALQPHTPAASPALAITPTGISTAEAAQDDRKPFVKRPGFWVMIGAIVVVGVGTGVAVALTRKDDPPQCGTTGDCATTQGLTVTSF
jgi:tetratricopeptide (TPR) repeat protein